MKLVISIFIKFCILKLKCFSSVIFQKKSEDSKKTDEATADDGVADEEEEKEEEEETEEPGILFYFVETPLFLGLIS